MAIELLMVDLGGVLLDIDPGRALHEFSHLYAGDIAEIAPKGQALLGHPVFRAFEKGELSPAGFRKELRAMGVKGTDAQLDAAWNALLLEPISGVVEVLRKWRKQYRLVLLSNTNLIHWEALKGPCREILACFDKCYLSFEMGMRKPGQEIFQAVLDAEGMAPGECWFMDDSPENLKGAEQLGIRVSWVGGNSGRWLGDVGDDLPV